MSQAATAQSGRSKAIGAIALAALGTLLVWQIATRSLAAYLAEESPPAALRLQANEPNALVALADGTLNPRNVAADSDAQPEAGREVLNENAAIRMDGLAEIALKAAAAKLSAAADEHGGAAALAGPPSPEVQAQARALALAALREDPLNARALRVLGQIAALEGETERAARLMRAAADRSLGESFAVYWLMQTSFEAKDPQQTVAYADVFLRKRPQFLDHAMPMLAQLAESGDERSVALLKSALVENPPWRQRFFEHLPKHTRDARTALNLLLSLKETEAPPTLPELNAYLSALFKNKRYELAYYTWLQFLPADELGEIGYLNNASFETSPTGLPFDWVMRQGRGATIDIAAVPGEAGSLGLLVELGPGRAEFHGVTQMLLLSPGDYRLKGKLKGEARGPRGLQWRMTCAATGKEIGAGPMFLGVEPRWSGFDFDFTVPDADCRAQELRLQLAARSASEQLVHGSVWYDDLSIARVEE
jgi:hypothetical protein